MKLSQSLPVAALAAALLVGACSEARNPAAPGPAFSTTSAPAITYSGRATVVQAALRSEEHTSELQSQSNLVCRLLLEKKKHEKLHAPPSAATTLHDDYV